MFNTRSSQYIYYGGARSNPEAKANWRPRGDKPRAPGSRESNRLRRFGLRLRSLARAPAPRAGGGPTAPAKTRRAGRDGDGAWRGECGADYGSQRQAGTPSFLHLRRRWIVRMRPKGARHVGSRIGFAACGYGGAAAPVSSPRRCRQRRAAGALDMPGGRGRRPSGGRFLCRFKPRPGRRPIR